MGGNKTYRRYTAGPVFGVVGSAWAGMNTVNIDGRQLVVVGACEQVALWDMKKGEKVRCLEAGNELVTCLAVANPARIAAGYNDGTVKVFDASNGQLLVTFRGHKSAVTALNFDKEGMRLVSGGKDTEVIVWDLVNERGLFRLRGHKGSVTQACFLSKCDVLITSAKDAQVKLWDLTTQHCFSTLLGHKTEVYDFVVCCEEQLLVTGAGDMEMKVWRIYYPNQEEESDLLPNKKMKTEEGDELGEDEEEEADETLVKCVLVGSLARQGKTRVVTLGLDSTQQFMAVHGNDNTLEVFKILTNDQMLKRVKQIKKKARKRGESELYTLSLDDRIQRVTNLRLESKLRSFKCLIENETKVKVVALLANNTIHSLTFDPTQKQCEGVTVGVLQQAGHRSDVRTVCFSSDNTAVMSASAETVKIWNRTSVQCIRTMKCQYALCCLFAPGDRHIIIGTKNGSLQVFDVAGGEKLETIEAHTGAVWSICLAPDKRGLVSGSADKMVKFWDFELIKDDDSSNRRLTLLHTRSLQLSEDVLGVKFSDNHRCLAVSLLDSTVKIFFTDSLKLLVSLYGHKLPALCLDISSDSTLIATGSADRNLKIWGMDFGDCHKSIFAHDDSIMCLRFLPQTHMLFTGGKDGLIKQWDADTFQLILTLKGHHGEVWSLAVSSTNNFLLSASHDKSLRLWEKSEETLILEEEREQERQEKEEKSSAEEQHPVVAGETDKEAGLAGRTSVDTVQSADRLIEALDLYTEENKQRIEHEEKCKLAQKTLPPPTPHPLLAAYNVSTPELYVLEVLKKIKSSELEESLLVVPFSCVVQLLPLLTQFIHSSTQTELACRILFFLLRIHQGQISVTPSLLPIIADLKTTTETQVNQIRDVMGFNQAGLQFLKRSLEEKEEVMLFTDATNKFQENVKKKRRAILTIKT